MTETLVRDVMRPPVLVPEGMWFRELARVLHDRGTDFATVVDALGRPVGAVTEEDLLPGLLERWLAEPPAGPERASGRADRRRAAALTARELMSEPLISVGESLPAAEAARLMRQRGVRHLAVLDADGWPAGQIDRHGLLTLLLRPDAEIRQDVEDLLARLLRADADQVEVEVRDGVAILRRAAGAGVAPGELVPDVLEVEGVLNARVAETVRA